MTKILLAEDDALIRDVIYNILALEGYEVFPTENGQQALDMFVSVKPDLIISDIMMPVMVGFELIEEVRALPLGVTIPFLFLSARTERGDVKRARALGVDDYLFKPFSFDELAKKTQVGQARLCLSPKGDLGSTKKSTYCFVK